MTEDQLKRIEGKIDLLYKILLKLDVDMIGHPYDHKYLKGFSNELVDLFSIELSPPDNVQEKLVKKLRADSKELETKYSQLKSKFEEKNYLAKDEIALKSELENLEENYLKIHELNENVTLLEEIILELNQVADSIILYVKLHQKLGIEVTPIFNRYTFNRELIQIIQPIEDELGLTFEDLLTLLSKYDLKILTDKLQYLSNSFKNLPNF